MSLNILIINEHESFCSFLSGLLASEGHVPLCCKGDRDALKVVTIWKPDLILLEASRPEIGVFDLVQRLERLDETRHIPMIVVSDCPELEFELMHAFDFLHKPVDMKRLREDIDLIRKGRKKVRQPQREQFTGEDFARFSDFLVTHSGLHFERRNVKALERGVASRMTALCIGTCQEYYEYLEKNKESRQELQKLLQFLTVGETFFFRYHSHFDALRTHLTNDYAGTPGKKLRIWSAGCSTGEEPYSLAMTIMEAIPDWRKRDIRILATDINNRSLKRAREGVYNRWAMRAMESHYLDTYFDQVGESYILRDEVKTLVQFANLNLQTGIYPFAEGDFRTFDAIFCRNVMIYFTHATTKKIVEKMAASLNPGGYLFLGHSETLAYTSSQFERQLYDGSFYYRKKSGVPPLVRLVAKSAKDTPAVPGGVCPAVPPAKTLHPPVEAEPDSSPTPVREEDVAAQYRKALLLFEAENYAVAETLIDEVLHREPRHERALILRGFVFANKGLFPEALTTCGQALELNDLLPEAYFLKGTIYDMLEKSPESVDEYRKAILLKMDFVMPHYQLGRLFIRLGRVKEGVRELRNTLRILEKGGEESLVPYSGGLSREVFLGQLRGELDHVMPSADQR